VITKLSSRIQNFVDQSIKYSHRSACDFVPWQHLLWISDSRKPTNLKIIPSGSLSLPALLQEIQFSFYHRLWHNTFNDESLLLNTQQAIFPECRITLRRIYKKFVSMGLHVSSIALKHQLALIFCN
jgi:hypothetical protein